MFRHHLKVTLIALVSLILSATLILANIGCSDKPIAKNTDEILNELPALIEKQMKDWQVPGLANGIVKDGEVIFAQGFGYRDREEQLPVTTKTMFPIASCSKAFAAMSAAITDGTMLKTIITTMPTSASTAMMAWEFNATTCRDRSSGLPTTVKLRRS